MRNGRGVNLFYYAFFITGSIKRESLWVPSLNVSS